MAKTIIVSNRLPLTIESGPDGVRIKRSAGGLATAIASCEAIASSIWIGWPGSTRGINAKDMAAVRQRLAEEHAVPVELTDREVEGYYERFANGAVWPLFHYMPSQLPLRVEGWEEYYRVNQKFAQAVVAGPRFPARAIAGRTHRLFSAHTISGRRDLCGAPASRRHPAGFAGR